MAERNTGRLADDLLLDRILSTVVDEVKRYAAFQRYHLSKYAEIGMSMSGEDDIAKLLEMIVFEAREITTADAGTLYMVNDSGTALDFVILQNDTMDTRMGGTSGKEITLPPVPLSVDGRENHGNVSSHVAITGEIVNIHDVYESDEFDFTGPRKYDQATGYRSKSMMVIPMRNHENDIIGVLQLLNALDQDTGETIPFSDEDVGLITALASQAAVAITKNVLIQDLLDLFNAFIKSIATAIEEKSKYTGGHIERVATLTVDIAKKINEVDFGPFKDTHFSDDEMEELRVAAWLHDIGKITTPEFVVDKANKLETIFDRVHLVDLRFDHILALKENEHLRRKNRLLAKGDAAGARALEENWKKAREKFLADKAFVLSCNHPGEFMADERIARLTKIGARTYVERGEKRPYLTEDEIRNLCIRKGTLTDEERKVIENHATMTHKILQELPFPKKLSSVPDYAAAHHEKLDGTGYPNRLKAEDISTQARIMAVADIFEALTAQDRPYKKPMPLSMAVKILGFMKKDNHIDADIHDLFLQSGVMQDYAGKYLNAAQIDLDLAVRPLEPRVLVVTPPGRDGADLCAALEGWGLRAVAAQSASHALAVLQEDAGRGLGFGVALVARDLLGRGGRNGLGAELARGASGFAGKVVALAEAGCALGDGAGADAGADAGAGIAATLPMRPAAQELKDTIFGLLGRTPPEGDFEGLDLAAAFEEHEVAPSDGRPLVLLVDDSVNTRMLLSYYFKNTPYAVVTAENGLQALEKFGAAAFDLVLMDVEMPGMDGYQVAAAMRAWEAEQGAERHPLVALTAHSYKGDDERRSAAGYDAVLTKPLRKADLMAMVDSLLAPKEGAPR
ncbi:MAG: response regulator [Desulfovibrionaceae bacterium]|jgi:HD-GYP domain-containing protein (c-di-GMP phosphodiesterase class II)/CheY-like chemotaxis protein|nr:response regulator [Desulfovibrionaceae bacterium]